MSIARVAPENKPKLEWPDLVRVVANSYQFAVLPSRKAESAIEPCGWVIRTDHSPGLTMVSVEYRLPRALTV
jgi:hypothetical protein